MIALLFAAAITSTICVLMRDHHRRNDPDNITRRFLDGDWYNGGTK